jgi:hypothetical protein
VTYSLLGDYILMTDRPEQETGMAMDRTRTRARSNRRGINGRRTRRTTMRGWGVDTSVVPRALVGAVNGVEIVAVGALRITRDVLVRTVAGAADIGAEALAATTAGVRGVVSAATRMLGDIAGAARGGLRETLSSVSDARRGGQVGALTPSPADNRSAAASRSTLTRRSRRRTRGSRAAARPGRPSLAA